MYVKIVAKNIRLSLPTASKRRDDKNIGRKVTMEKCKFIKERMDHEAEPVLYFLQQEKTSIVFSSG